MFHAVRRALPEICRNLLEVGPAQQLGFAAALPSKLHSTTHNCVASKDDAPVAKKWSELVKQGVPVNPCGSVHHPAAIAGVINVDGQSEAISLQEAYTPESTCYGCGPSANEHALHLQSFRAPDGLVAKVSISPQYQCFPGIIAGGVIATLMECHGNWTAAVELMDSSCLPKPPLTVTYSLLVTYREPTPPDTPLIIRSKVTSVKSGSAIGVGKTTVEVDLALYEELRGGGERLLVTGAGIFKRMGALRAL